MTRDPELRAVLGYLNFSEGAFSPKFHLAIDDFFEKVRGESVEGWPRLAAELRLTLEAWSREGSPFGDVERCGRIVELAADGVAPAYRAFHEDLLHHLPDAELFQPYFVGRIFEQTLAEAAATSSPREPSPDGDAAFALRVVHRLNDFIGYRPKVVLEGRKPLEAYPHERVAAVPLYLRRVGVAKGPTHRLTSGALELLRNAEPSLLRDAWLDLDAIEELALDPRAYDHHHPANQRPGHQFGEWDPHRLDANGRYSRFITRRVIMKTLERWLAGEAKSPTTDYDERVKESAAVLAGTILLASGVAGGGPGDLTSDHTPAVIVAHVSRIRDQFYADLVAKWPGSHGERLRKEAIRDRQPFGRLRQHLNLELGRLRALQLQHDGVARQYARLGRREAAEIEAERVESPACRLQCRIESNFVGGERAIGESDRAKAAEFASESASLIRRAIDCGASPDPWGLLAFQGHYPLFDHLAESAHDSRVERLLESVERLFRLYARAWASAASAGDEKTVRRCGLELDSLTEWWNQFASHEVSGLRRVNAYELLESARFVARVSWEWRQAGGFRGDVAFWRRSAEDFTAVQSYTLILETLLQADDLIAAQALIAHWLASGRATTSESEGAEFARFARRWLRMALELPADERRPIVARFFELLEANAEEWWYAPAAEFVGGPPHDEPAIESPLEDLDDDFDANDVVAAAYENVTYKDSTGDGVEGSMMEAGPPGGDADDLLQLQASLERRLEFLNLVARLLQRTAAVEGRKPNTEIATALASWSRHMEANRRKLFALGRALQDTAGAAGSDNPEALGEFGRRQAIRDEMLEEVIACTIETVHAFHLLSAAAGAKVSADVASWEAKLVRTRSFLMRGNRAKFHDSLADLFAALKPLVVLYLPLHLGGKPQRVAKARLAREAMRRLGEDLPRAGSFLDAYRLLEVARRAERNGLRDVRMVTEFESVFTGAFRSTMDVLTALLSRWPETKNRDDAAAEAIRRVMQPFTRLWKEHVGGVRISEIERRPSSQSWERSKKFIRRYGGELFGQKMLQYGNIRGILAKGVEEHVKSLEDGDDDERPAKLLADLGGAVSREEAAEEIGFVLQVVYSHYDLFRDYNTTTTQSDYGENIHVLLDLVRVSVAYDRDWWAMRPVYLAHRELTAAGRNGVAELLRAAFVSQMAPVADARQRDLAEVERKNGVVLASVRDKINERFARPFELDGALAFVARSAADDEVFARLRRTLDAFASTPTGSGFEPPDWLRKLEAEVDRIVDDDERAEEPRIALPKMTYADFQRQLTEWEGDEPHASHD
jgi:hypothetical protein